MGQRFTCVCVRKSGSHYSTIIALQKNLYIINTAADFFFTFLATIDNRG